MADVFYEVDEQLRSARLRSLFRRGWPFAAGVLALALVAALCIWAWRAHETAAEGDDSQRYADAMQILSAGDAKGAETRFAALGKDGTPAYRAMSLMQEAGIRMKAGDAAGAARLLDQAAGASHDRITSDGAKLRAAFLLMDVAPYDQTRARLEPLTGDGRPFRMLAREGLAMAELASGRAAQAKGDLQVLSLSSDVSDTSRARAQAALAMIRSGAGANLGAIAKAAVGLKPAPPAPAPSGLTPEQAAAIQAAQAQGGGQGGAPDAGGGQTPSGAPQ